MSNLNKEAKKERHKKLYEGQYHSFVGKLWFHTKRISVRVWRKVTPSTKAMSRFMHPLDHMPAPKRLYTQISIWSIGLLMLSSVNVTTAATQGGYGVGAAYVYEGLDITGESYLTDDEGYLIKSMPLEGERVYDLNRNEIVEHEVQSGETLSVIAYRYGVTVSSIRYQNSSIGNSDYLKVGQTLEIPPKDGLYIEVESGDALAKLVEKHKGDLEATMEFNDLSEDSELIAGKEIFIIDGEPDQVYIAATPTYSASSASTATSTAPISVPAVTQYNIPASAEGWIRPTQGRITQGYRGGHLAYDVADRNKPPILAAASGTVIKASSGTWGGGYGNHIIIDHGNGYQTLYAHAEVLYVSVGETVQQGQVIAKMGNTGRVYGATGIHLHFEISFNGVKQSPSIMGVW